MHEALEFGVSGNRAVVVDMLLGLGVSESREASIVLGIQRSWLQRIWCSGAWGF